MVTGSVAFGAVVRQNIMVRVPGRGSFSPHSSWEAKTEEKLESQCPL
jgi:hypothetical protein